MPQVNLFLQGRGYRARRGWDNTRQVDCFIQIISYSILLTPRITTYTYNPTRSFTRMAEHTEWPRTTASIFRLSTRAASCSTRHLTFSQRELLSRPSKVWYYSFSPILRIDIDTAHLYDMIIILAQIINIVSLTFIPQIIFLFPWRSQRGLLRTSSLRRPGGDHTPRSIAGRVAAKKQQSACLSHYKQVRVGDQG